MSENGLFKNKLQQQSNYENQSNLRAASKGGIHFVPSVDQQSYHTRYNGGGTITDNGSVLRNVDMSTSSKKLADASGDFNRSDNQYAGPNLHDQQKQYMQQLKERENLQNDLVFEVSNDSNISQ